LRQRNFANKMVVNIQISQWINQVSVQNDAIIGYCKFLHLMNDKPNIPLVPTLDIDLGWHTHILHGQNYRAWNRKYLLRIVNHSDTIPKKTLNDGYVETESLWSREYKEAYVAPNSPENLPVTSIV
ncbi:24092_t:CDS:1, partial [Dentiscutata erythropus]